MGRDILDHYGAGADHHIVADGHAGADDHIAAEPYVIADGDRACTFRPGCAYRRVDGMIRGVQAYARPEEHAIADGDPRHVKEDAVHVGVEVVADIGVAPVVAVEWRFEERALAERAEQFVEQPVALFEGVVCRRVDGLHQAAFAHVHFMLLRIVRNI